MRAPVRSKRDVETNNNFPTYLFSEKKKKQHKIKMGNKNSHQAYLETQISNISGKDIATIQEFYSDFQKDCPDGRLTPEKFSDLCDKVLGTPKTEEFKKAAFGRFDKHNNGSINFRDFLMVIHLTSSGSPLDKLKTMFSLFDQDGNGFIDAEEIKRSLI